MKIYITRHGETLENIEGRLMGHLPGNLSEKGKEQAKKLALRLKDEKIDFIYSSDLKRATDTSFEIARFHPEAGIYFTRDIRERFLGSYEGRIKSECPEIRDYIPGNLEAPDGESLREMYQRAGAVIKSLRKIHSVGNLLIVGHNGINRGLIGNLLGKPFEEYTTLPVQHNCSLSIFDIINEEVKIDLLNCTMHLN